MQMPLWVHLLVSAAAIAAIAMMVRRLRPGIAPPMTPDKALRLFREDFPRAESSNAEMAPDRRTSIIFGPSGAVLGCVTLVGLRWTARRIGGRDIVRAEADGAHTRITFDDYTWPALTMSWTDANEAQAWAQRFNAMRRPDHA